ncbi:MAG: hypothetical protein WD512_19580 [Candidatus Paceibacterota bacterium]
MPSGIEVHYGYMTTESSLDFAKRIGLNIEFKHDTYYEDHKSHVFIELQARLLKAYIATIEHLGWSFHTNKTSPIDYAVKTPWGWRTVKPFSMWNVYDPDMSFEMTLGVRLSSRYFPALLDLKDPHGGLPNPYHLNYNDQMIMYARANLVREIPELYDASLYIRELFY